MITGTPDATDLATELHQYGGPFCAEPTQQKRSKGHTVTGGSRRDLIDAHTHARTHEYTHTTHKHTNTNTCTVWRFMCKVNLLRASSRASDDGGSSATLLQTHTLSHPHPHPTHKQTHIPAPIPTHARIHMHTVTLLCARPLAHHQHPPLHSLAFSPNCARRLDEGEVKDSECRVSGKGIGCSEGGCMLSRSVHMHVGHTALDEVEVDEVLRRSSAHVVEKPVDLVLHPRVKNETSSRVSKRPSIPGAQFRLHGQDATHQPKPEILHHQPPSKPFHPPPGSFTPPPPHQATMTTPNTRPPTLIHHMSTCEDAFQGSLKGWMCG